MSDYLVNLASQPAARALLKSVGLPTPPVLAREQGPYPYRPLEGKRVALGTSANARAESALKSALEAAGAEVITGEIASGEDAPKLNGIVFDATGVATPTDLKSLYSYFHPVMRAIGANARVLVVAPLPEAADSSGAAACARGVEGFVRSIGKEIGKRGATANVLYVERGAEDRVEMPVRFFMTGRSAYVDGQPLRIMKRVSAPKSAPLTATLADKVALVTGGARGIGAATAKRLAEEGAHVVCLDIPQDEETLKATAASVNGTPLAVDITAEDAPAKIAAFLKEKFGGVDVVIHNAGITRDKTLANMAEHLWDMVLNVNLAAILRINEQLQKDNLLREGARIVCLSSIGGIAGNMGQTNYGATKAALIGYVAAEAPKLASRGICINAVAPGFIETRMTAAMPFMIREAGRRMNSMSQGGLPEDVAELITFLSTPGAFGASGNTIRVCGQSLIGA